VRIQGAATLARLAGARRGRRRTLVTLGLVAAMLTGINLYAAYAVSALRSPRAAGIPANVPASLASEMRLSPLHAERAPGFTLTDQRGRTMALSGLRGKVVVLDFMDPHCADVCPIVSQEFVQAYRELGPLASKVVFAAVNVNRYHASVGDVAAFSSALGLSRIPGWHFFTGPAPALRKIWDRYHIEVQAPGPGADVEHSSSMYFIGAQGAARFVASPVMEHNADGDSYLPLPRIRSWAHGIALLAGDMAR
jgi:protein SCO1